MSSYSSLSALHPHDAYLLHQATLRAVAMAGTSDEAGRHDLTDAVFFVAESGYARKLDGTLDPDALAEAAVTRFRNFASQQPIFRAPSQRRKYGIEKPFRTAKSA